MNRGAVPQCGNSSVVHEESSGNKLPTPAAAGKQLLEQFRINYQKQPNNNQKQLSHMRRRPVP
jgi:hypothetical protein